MPPFSTGLLQDPARSSLTRGWQIYNVFAVKIAHSGVCVFERAYLPHLCRWSSGALLAAPLFVLRLLKRIPRQSPFVLWHPHYLTPCRIASLQTKLRILAKRVRDVATLRHHLPQKHSHN